MSNNPTSRSPTPTHPMSKKRYLVTAALPYANGPLHIGHLAGAYLPADIFVRYLRLMGKDVVFVCGSDEHGAAITVKARKEETTPRAVVDKYHAMLRDTFQKIGISFDIYHRTTEPIHHQTSQDFFRKLNENQEFLEETTEQYYDETVGQFLADRYIVGTCPVCANPDAYGDQCEKCGSTLSPTDLIHPHSMLSGSVPVKRPQNTGSSALISTKPGCANGSIPESLMAYNSTTRQTGKTT